MHCSISHCLTHFKYIFRSLLHLKVVYFPFFSFPFFLCTKFDYSFLVRFDSIELTSFHQDLFHFRWKHFVFISMINISQFSISPKQNQITSFGHCRGIFLRKIHNYQRIFNSRQNVWRNILQSIHFGEILKKNFTSCQRISLIPHWCYCHHLKKFGIEGTMKFGLFSFLFFITLCRPSFICMWQTERKNEVFFLFETERKHNFYC